jgi:hypothetical protein
MKDDLLALALVLDARAAAALPAGLIGAAPAVAMLAAPGIGTWVPRVSTFRKGAVVAIHKSLEIR